MKKIILTALVLGVWCVTIAQDDQQQNKNIKFGVKTGINLANANGNGVELFTDGKKSDSRLGIAIGAVLEYGISEKFSVQSELYYSQQGFKTGMSSDVVKLDYINIPILAKYYINDDLSFEIGPQLGFLLSSKYDSNEQDDLIDSDNSVANKKAYKRSALNETDLKEYFTKLDFGLNFGLSYQLKTGLGFNARYNLGLKDIFEFERIIRPLKKIDENRADDVYEIKNNVLNVSVFYTF